jgi:hypothetical protein
MTELEQMVEEYKSELLWLRAMGEGLLRVLKEAVLHQTSTSAEEARDTRESLNGALLDYFDAQDLFLVRESPDFKELPRAAAAMVSYRSKLTDLKAKNRILEAECDHYRSRVARLSERGEAR